MRLDACGDGLGVYQSWRKTPGAESEPNRPSQYARSPWLGERCRTTEYQPSTATSEALPPDLPGRAPSVLVRSRYSSEAATFCSTHSIGNAPLATPPIQQLAPVSGVRSR